MVWPLFLQFLESKCSYPYPVNMSTGFSYELSTSHINISNISYDKRVFCFMYAVSQNYSYGQIIGCKDFLLGSTTVQARPDGELYLEH